MLLRPSSGAASSPRFLLPRRPPPINHPSLPALAPIRITCLSNTPSQPPLLCSRSSHQQCFPRLRVPSSALGTFSGFPRMSSSGTPLPIAHPHGSFRSYSWWPFASAPPSPPPEEMPPAPALPTIPPPPEPLPPPPLVDESLAEVTASVGPATRELAALELEHGFFARHSSGTIEKILCSIHDHFALPWYLTIPVVILALRTVLIPTNIWSMRIGANNMRVKPKLDVQIAEIRELQAKGEQHRALSKQQELRDMMKAEGFRPLAPLGLPLVQGTLFVSFFWALREMGNHRLGSLTTEGALWFTDMTVAGPWYGLPLLASGLTLLSVETAAEMGGMKSGQSPKVMWVLRTVIVGTLWLFHDLPSAVFLYWCTNNLFSLIWASFVRLAPQSLKDKLRIPNTNVTAQEDGSKQQVSFLDGFKSVLNPPTTAMTNDSSNENIPKGSQKQVATEVGGGVEFEVPIPKVWKPELPKTRPPTHPQRPKP